MSVLAGSTWQVCRMLLAATNALRLSARYSLPQSRFRTPVDVKLVATGANDICTTSVHKVQQRICTRSFYSLSGF